MKATIMTKGTGEFHDKREERMLLAIFLLKSRKASESNWLHYSFCDIIVGFHMSLCVSPLVHAARSLQLKQGLERAKALSAIGMRSLLEPHRSSLWRLNMSTVPPFNISLLSLYTIPIPQSSSSKAYTLLKWMIQASADLSFPPKAAAGANFVDSFGDALSY